MMNIFLFAEMKRVLLTDELSQLFILCQMREIFQEKDFIVS